SGQVSQAPMGYAGLLSALLFAFGPTYEVVIAGDPDADDTKAMLKALKREYFPNQVTLFRPAEDTGSSILHLAEFIENQVPIDGKATAYICQDYTCSAPTTDIKEMLNLLNATIDDI
ncbi:MAG: hypothetical protein KAS84_05955, partial [Anaerolineales bacterium]|nr:hypothetical protein [Anaerolineales bacterium]